MSIVHRVQQGKSTVSLRHRKKDLMKKMKDLREMIVKVAPVHEI
jgi:hypothetical protein